jgi:hypothetical protein
MAKEMQLQEGQVLTGPWFNEPMRVESVRAGGDRTWSVGLVGTQSERFCKVTLTAQQIAEDRRDCYCLYVVTDCATTPRLDTRKDPASMPWNEVIKVSHYYLSVDAMTNPISVRENETPYGRTR